MGNAALEIQDEWVPARLLPTAGIRNQGEQEKRAASALLAVMSAVPDFCNALLAGMKAHKGKISTFTELRFKDDEERLHIPDGALVIERGQKQWSCLVEIKTDGATLESDQVSRYLDLAREHGFDGFLTISNQICGDSQELPYSVRKLKLKGLTVRHLSWWHVLTEAIVQHRFRGIADPDQAWILGELIRYLDDESPVLLDSRVWDKHGSESAKARATRLFVQTIPRRKRLALDGSSSSSISVCI